MTDPKPNRAARRRPQAASCKVCGDPAPSGVCFRCEGHSKFNRAGKLGKKKGWR
jgi:hypothetical protein